jgi:adenosylmethionine---8-amino-7-oxononanoate aminotransferase
MPDFIQNPPLVIEKAEGSYLYTDQGKIIDAISSWWCKSLGHAHPKVTQAISNQLQRFEHIIGANTTYPEIVELAERLSDISGKQHVFFASDGSCAVEIALKLALHACQVQGLKYKNKFIALKNGYHGETLATLSVSDVGKFKSTFPDLDLTCQWITKIPYVSGEDDPLWSNCSSIWLQVLADLEAVKHHTCAIILEPIVQGAGGMRCYSMDFLRRLAAWAKRNQIYLIADEIMTGLGRTGKWLATQHAGVQPDLICLSKGLTSGSLPLSCVLIDHEIYELCNDPSDRSKDFLHSHTYSGNPLAVSAALATINAMYDENIITQAQNLGSAMRKAFDQIATQTSKINNIRSIGAIVAGDLIGLESGYKIAQTAIKMGALLRPLGNTIYWLPPLNMQQNTLDELTEITYKAIMAKK